MPLGTLDRTPPPFFRQGTSALTKLVVCAALSLFLMVADSRFGFVAALRAGLATALLPLQRAMLVPVDLLAGGGDYLRGLQEAQQAEREARAAQLELAKQARQAEILARENERLRALLALGPALQARSFGAEVMFEARDAYSRKVFIDRGQAQGVLPGAPVIGRDGVLGQVTRVYPLSAEVTLLIDKDAAIPVLNRRTRQPGVAFGGLQGPDGPMLELRFLSANADVRPGDELETSGLDGVYPPALPVAQVVSVERRVEGGFARVLLLPAMTGDGVRHVLVLEPMALQRPPIVGAPASAPASGAEQRPAPAARKASSPAGGAAQASARKQERRP